MGLNFEKAHEIGEFGLAATDADDTPQFYLTGGIGSPVGTSSVVPTLYLQDNGDLWQNFGTGVNDWKVIGSSDLCIGGVSASYTHTSPNCVGGGDANGD